MFLKLLKISSVNGTIREIRFGRGINLIVDESEEQITGNNVGKTTVLKLIDFCLGGNQREIYVDPETKKDEYRLVKDFLTQNEVLITLILTDDLEKDSGKIIKIERNFLLRKNKIQRINGQELTDEEFETKLSNLIFPNHHSDKPSFRQIISHNIRYKDESINNTLKTLDKYTSDAEYETLYLYLLGCDFEDGNTKQEILGKLKLEENFKKRLEEQQTKTAYESALGLVNNEIEELDKQKKSLNINENFEKDLNNLNTIKYNINSISMEISKLNIRKQLIIEAEKDLDSSKSDIDLQQLDLIYQQASSQLTNLQKTFEELVQYHNKMITEKVKFITKDLPNIEESIAAKKNTLKKFLSEEKEFSVKVSKSDSYQELEELIAKLNDQYRKKGEYEKIIQQLNEVEGNIVTYSRQLDQIDDELFSEKFENKLKAQVNKFNKFFSSVSSYLYNEQYALKYDVSINKKNGRKVYKFSAFNTNLSSGKKQGEISCFDIAYIFFADEEKFPALHFILNDKKELMHDNQLVKISELANKSNMQFVASILKDKLPKELENEEYYVVKLSQKDKLFRIEHK